MLVGGPFGYVHHKGTPVVPSIDKTPPPSVLKPAACEFKLPNFCPRRRKIRFDGLPVITEIGLCNSKSGTF